MTAFGMENDMKDNKQPDALRLAALYYADAWPDGFSLNAWAAASVAELHRLHAENAALQKNYDAVQAAHADVAGQCEDAIELLGKYKELCEEIKRGDSYHLGRIEAAISVLTQADSQSVPVWEEEREAFKAAHRHLGLDEVPDAWGQPTFKHSHVEASWLGWIARAARTPSRRQRRRQIDTRNL
jgi:hypothetical protein